MPYAFSRTISDVLCTFKRFHNFIFHQSGIWVYLGPGVKVGSLFWSARMTYLISEASNVEILTHLISEASNVEILTYLISLLCNNILSLHNVICTTTSAHIVITYHHISRSISIDHVI